MGSQSRKSEERRPNNRYGIDNHRKNYTQLKMIAAQPRLVMRTVRHVNHYRSSAISSLRQPTPPYSLITFIILQRRGDFSCFEIRYGTTNVPLAVSLPHIFLRSARVQGT